MRIDDSAPYANASLVRLTIDAQIFIHIHIHMYIHAYVFIYIYKCIYIYVYMFVHIHTYTYIHTHIRHVHLHTRKHAWNDSVAATAREALLEARKLHPFPCPLQSGRESPSVASSPIALSRGTTHKRRTTTTNRSSSHHHDTASPSSVLVQNQSTRSMAVPAAGHEDHARNRVHIPATFLPFRYDKQKQKKRYPVATKERKKRRKVSLQIMYNISIWGFTVS